jgi:UDP-N-acetylglucosamine 2-epimerase (non-hydrolysing)/GDP/UDP-N,N'-diacetylbacillosamine 2-epimerase (hydrolysing)
VSGRTTICAVSGSRADYGLLHWPLRLIAEHPRLTLQLVVTGQHLSPEHGSTYRQIVRDGFTIAAKVETLLGSDSAAAVAKSLGLGVIGFADVLASLHPDLLLVLGDRFEILAAVEAALISGIPVAHIAGGDLTLGAFDDAIRHSISKMSHLHFVTNAESGKRVRQLGEAEDRIFNFGSPGIDTLRRAQLKDRATLARELGLRFAPRNLLITHHPVTLAREGSLAELGALLAALDTLGDQVGLFFTMPNSDPGGRELAHEVERFVRDRPHASLHASLGSTNYFSVMAQVDALVGNSSSGFYEAPSLKKPAVNVGDRQRGRLRPASVIDCAPDAASIRDAIERALVLDCSDVSNPYGDGHSAERIVEVLARIADPQSLLERSFHDLP